MKAVLAALLCSCNLVVAGEFHDESELGVVITTGNAQSESFNAKQTNSYTWTKNLLRLQGAYLYSGSNVQVTARHWNSILRYEHEITSRLSGLAAQSAEGDPFAGYRGRFETDVGTKYWFNRREKFNWAGESGYRYMVENRIDSVVVKQRLLRFYTETNWNWTKSAALKSDVEYLPNLTDPNDYRINGEIELSVFINDTFSIKNRYSVAYRNQPPPPAHSRSDTEFTTALAARF